MVLVESCEPPGADRFMRVLRWRGSSRAATGLMLEVQEESEKGLRVEKVAARSRPS